MPDEAIVPATPGGSLALPDHLKDVHSHEGFGNMDREDMILPRLSICQALSPQRNKQKPSFIAGLNDGDLFNTITGRIYGGRVEVIPVLFSKSRIYFRPIKEGGGILCQSFNGIDGGTLSATCAACPNSQFGAKGEAPLCNVFYNYPAIMLPDRELAVISLKSTGLKVARQWNSRMKMLGDKPMFAGVYEIVTTEQTTSKGTFFGPSIRFKRFVAVDELAFATNLFASIKGKTIRADEPAADEADEPVPF